MENEEIFCKAAKYYWKYTQNIIVCIFAQQLLLYYII